MNLREARLPRYLSDSGCHISQLSKELVLLRRRQAIHVRPRAPVCVPAPVLYHVAPKFLCVFALPDSFHILNNTPCYHTALIMRHKKDKIEIVMILSREEKVKVGTDCASKFAPTAFSRAHECHNFHTPMLYVVCDAVCPVLFYLVFPEQGRSRSAVVMTELH